MSWFHALLLGLLQGITEFFPVSSSAHLQLGKKWLGVPTGEETLYFDLACHFATLLALLWFLRRDVWDVLQKPREMLRYTLAIAPLFPAYFLAKPLRIALSDPTYLGGFLLCSGILLFAASRVTTLQRAKWHHPLWIGSMQALALLPGISRSGATISMGRFCGWEWEKAAKFSFLLAIPTILGGEILETRKIFQEGFLSAVPLSSYLVGTLSAFLAGMGSVRLVFWMYAKKQILPFALYCILLGMIVLFL